MSEALVQQGLNREQIDLLKRTICVGANDNEFAMFVQVCNRLKLDPFAKQIYAVKRWNAQARQEVLTPQVSIDGLRLVAERSGKYRGQTPTEWCGPDGVWKDVWLDKNPPSAARSGVIRDGYDKPIYAVAKFDSYAPRKKDGGLNHMWQNMPEVMIGKCSESLALRKAFPQELSGVYTNEEMQQAGGEAIEAVAEDPTPATLALIERIRVADDLTDKKLLEDLGNCEQRGLLVPEFKARKETLAGGVVYDPGTGEVIHDDRKDDLMKKVAEVRKAMGVK